MKSKYGELTRELRKNMTSFERKLWEILSNSQMGDLKWRRQHPLPPYIADFFCAAAKVVVELDGRGHEGQIEYDAARDNWMKEQGILVLRFSNWEFENNVEGVWEAIRETCLKRIENGEGNSKVIARKRKG